MRNLLIFFFLFFVSIACEDEKYPLESKSKKCDLLPDPGLCKALIPKYYFDKNEGKCKEFSWGGCAGVVPFDTLEECEQCECGQSTDD